MIDYIKIKFLDLENYRDDLSEILSSGFQTIAKIVCNERENDGTPYIVYTGKYNTLDYEIYVASEGYWVSVDIYEMLKVPSYEELKDELSNTFKLIPETLYFDYSDIVDAYETQISRSYYFEYNYSYDIYLPNWIDSIAVTPITDKQIAENIPDVLSNSIPMVKVNEINTAIISQIEKVLEKNIKYLETEINFACSRLKSEFVEIAKRKIEKYYAL